MKRLVLLFIPALALATAFADGPSARVSHVWIRVSPPGVGVDAGYLHLDNLTGKPLSLDAVTSPDFASVEIHQSIVKDGVESMQPVPKLDIPSQGGVDLKPGGYHLMLMNPRKNLFPGDTVSLSLSFSDGSELLILAPVRRDAPP
jgi:copper(I)-binding protein